MPRPQLNTRMLKESRQQGQRCRDEKARRPSRSVAMPSSFFFIYICMGGYIIARIHTHYYPQNPLRTSAPISRCVYCLFWCVVRRGAPIWQQRLSRYSRSLPVSCLLLVHVVGVLVFFFLGGGVLACNRRTPFSTPTVPFPLQNRRFVSGWGWGLGWNPHPANNESSAPSVQTRGCSLFFGAACRTSTRAATTGDTLHPRAITRRLRPNSRRHSFSPTWRRRWVRLSRRAVGSNCCRQRQADGKVNTAML